MKKITTLSTLLVMAIAVNAQENNAPGPIIDAGFMRELINISGVLVGMFLVGSFFLNIIRYYLDGKLKNLKQINWYIQPRCAQTGEGLFQGLNWLVGQL